MRPKFVIALFLAAGVVLAAALFLKQQFLTSPASPVPSAPPVAISEAAAPVPAASDNVAKKVSLPLSPSAPAAAVTLTPEQRQAAIDTETVRLRQESMSDNPADLTNLLADLTSPEKEIREAAVQALIQFGDTNAIPVLRAAAANTTNVQEQAEMTDAANFIALPNMNFSPSAAPKTDAEIQAQREKIAQLQAAKQATIQRDSHIRNPQQPVAPAAGQDSTPPPNN